MEAEAPCWLSVCLQLHLKPGGAPVRLFVSFVVSVDRSVTSETLTETKEKFSTTMQKSQKLLLLCLPLEAAVSITVGGQFPPVFSCFISGFKLIFQG